MEPSRGCFVWPYKILHQYIKWCYNAKNNGQFLQNVGHASGRAHISGHIHHHPFERMYYAFSDHWLWVVVFYTLYLMVPLLEQHLHFTWHSITTEGVDLRGTEVQPYG